MSSVPTPARGTQIQDSLVPAFLERAMGPLLSPGAGWGGDEQCTDQEAGQGPRL